MKTNCHILGELRIFTIKLKVPRKNNIDVVNEDKHTLVKVF